ncbi:hypothetical protein RJD24_03390 [Bacillaceae bacterium IKA-2]|nr:hypothetical protein RJD24_03390 [Bacillaceae bacterium IKA-2]
MMNLDKTKERIITMKKMFTTFIIAGLIFTGASQTFAMGEKNQNGTFNLGQKITSHEDMSVQEIKNMYLMHHYTLGAAPSKNFQTHDDCMN